MFSILSRFLAVTLMRSYRKTKRRRRLENMKTPFTEGVNGDLTLWKWRFQHLKTAFSETVGGGRLLNGLDAFYQSVAQVDGAVGNLCQRLVVGDNDEGLAKLVA